MATATVAASGILLGGKALLEKADRSFRLSQFESAFKSCDEAVKSSEFKASWKDKKRHEVIKTYIVYGRQSGRSQAVLNWLILNKAQLPDYPLYLCEWVHVELGDKDPKKLRTGSHEAMKKSEQHLNEVLSEVASEGTQKASSKIIDMCLNTLIDKVLLPNGQAAKADQLLKEHSQHLSKDSEAALKKRVQEARKPAAVVSTPRISGRAVPGERLHAGSSAISGPPVSPDSVIGQIVRTWNWVVDKLGGNQVVAYSVAFLGIWYASKVLFQGQGQGSPQPPPAVAPDEF